MLNYNLLGGGEYVFLIKNLHKHLMFIFYIFFIYFFIFHIVKKLFNPRGEARLPNLKDPGYSEF